LAYLFVVGNAETIDEGGKGQRILLWQISIADFEELIFVRSRMSENASDGLAEHGVGFLR
jgi:hypothetical protein